MNAPASEPIHSQRHGGLLTIDRGAIRRNWRRLANKVGNASTGAVVKANAYGLGIETVVPALLEEGCRHFFVAHLSEAIRTRKSAPNTEIFVLNGFLPETGPAYLTHQLSPVLGSQPEIDDWRHFTARNTSSPPATLHFDTGLNRLGLSPSSAPDISDAITNHTLGFTVSLVMTHLVEAEIEDSPVTRRQCDAFLDLRALFKQTRASLCNSSGIFNCAGQYYDLLRPGYALYGGHPLWSAKANPMEQVIRLEAPIIQVRGINAGEKLGYGGLYTATRPTKLATLSIGYADGLMRGAERRDDKAGGYVLIGGNLCPILGRLSMDLLIVDVTDAKPEAVQRGAMATIIGDELSIDAVGDSAGTIGYDVLVSLGNRFDRHVID